MEDSILDTIKKLLGIDPEYTAFDVDIITFINSQWLGLNQVGVGPTGGFSITGPEEKWSDFIQESSYQESVKTFIYANVRMLFDPPSTNHAQESLRIIAKESAWRLNVQTETEGVVDA